MERTRQEQHQQQHQEWIMTAHSQARMQQRGITEKMMEIALIYGERHWSHGSICYCLTERSLRAGPHAAESDRLRGLCVVLSSDGIVVTVKWNFRLRRPGPLRRAHLVDQARHKQAVGQIWDGWSQGSGDPGMWAA